MKIVITGVAGLLGSRLADWIQTNTEHEVIGIDDLSATGAPSASTYLCGNNTWATPAGYTGEATIKAWAAFDGDGDRVGVIDNTGNEIFSDKIGLLFARNLSKKYQGS